MADDASFHSCCDELQHHYSRQHQHQQHQHHCPIWSVKGLNGSCGSGGGGGDNSSGDCSGGCCCGYSDTDDEAQFLTASNSLEASANLLDDGALDGCLGGALERTLGGGDGVEEEEKEEEEDSRQKMSPLLSASPGSCAPSAPVASTVSAAAERRQRDSSCSSSSCSSSSSSGDEAAGFVGEEFPLALPLASSSQVSLRDLRLVEDEGLPAADSVGAVDIVVGEENDNTAACLDTDPSAIPATPCDYEEHRNLDSHEYYTDNDLTPHRPASRRTRSGPIIRQAFSTDNLLVRAGWLQLQQQPDSGPRPSANALTLGAASGLSNTPAPAADDFPSRLRKRVRFADALGFDLTSVVVIAACTSSSIVRELESDFETFLLDAENELNRGRLFAESQSLSSITQQQQQQPPPPPQSETQSPPVDPLWISLAAWEPAAPTNCRPVALESVRFDGPAMELSARVLNLAPQKSLMARVTFDNWSSQADWSLRYCAAETASGAEAGAPQSELFRIRLYLPPNARGVQLALRYCAAGREFWDNNAGRNYAYKRYGSADQ